MNNIVTRYIIHEGVENYGSGYTIYDKQEQREICRCSLLKDAHMIIGLLNRIEESEQVYKIGG